MRTISGLMLASLLWGRWFLPLAGDSGQAKTADEAENSTAL